MPQRPARGPPCHSTVGNTVLQRPAPRRWHGGRNAQGRASRPPSAGLGRSGLETVNLDEVLLDQALLGQELVHVLALVPLELDHLWGLMTAHVVAGG